MQQYIITVVLVCALQLIAITSSSPAVDSSTSELPTVTDTAAVGPTLNILTATPDEIEGEYYSTSNEENHGIHFHSVTNEDDSYFIQITTTDGAPLYTIKASHSSNSYSMVYILGTQFMITNYSNGSIVSVEHYHVLPDYQQAVDKAIVSSDQKSLKILTKLLNKVKRRNKQHVKLSILPRFLRRPEIELIRAAALAVENSGSEMSETIAAMTFYELSLQLKIAKTKLLKKDEGPRDSDRLTKRQSSGDGDGVDDFDYYDDYYYFDAEDYYDDGECDLVEVCVEWSFEYVCDC